MIQPPRRHDARSPVADKGRAATLACLAVLALGACSANAGEPGSSDQPGNESASASEAAPASPGDGDEDGSRGSVGGPLDDLMRYGRTAAADDSPLVEFLGPGAIALENGWISYSLGGGEAALTEEQIQELRDAQEFIADCMAERGFEYVPHVVTEPGQPQPLSEPYSLPAAEFAEQYGYGTTTIDFPLEAPDVDMPVNPNEEIRNSLSGPAQQEYDRALHGAKPDETGDDPEPGCQGEAAAEVAIGDKTVIGDSIDVAGFGGLRDDLFGLAERIAAAPRLDRAADQWQSCMAEAGYTVGPTAMEMDEINALGTIFLARVDVRRQADELTGWAQLLEELPEDYSGEIEPPDVEIDPVELRELREYEVAVASADYACRVEHVDAVFSEVWYELEAGFIEQHRDELEALREHLIQTGDEG